MLWRVSQLHCGNHGSVARLKAPAQRRATQQLVLNARKAAEARLRAVSDMAVASLTEARRRNVLWHC